MTIMLDSDVFSHQHMPSAHTASHASDVAEHRAFDGFCVVAVSIEDRLLC